MDTTEKAGRKLSKASADKVRAAIAMLMELLDDMPEMEVDGMKPEEMAGMDKPKPKGLDIPEEVAAKLAAFAKEATNG